MAQGKKVQIEKRRKVHTYAELWLASQFHLECGRRQPQGAARHFLASVTFTAFSFEAYLNHIGPEFLNCWADVERLRVVQKARLLIEVGKVDLLWHTGRRPVQTIEKLFSLRNSIAHGRSEELAATTRHVSLKGFEKILYEPLLADWEEPVQDRRFALRARTDSEIVMRLLQGARPNPPDNLFTTGIGSGSATIVA